MPHKLRHTIARPLTTVFATVLLLSACGGGSGDEVPAVPEAPAVPAIPAANHIGAEVDGTMLMITAKRVEGWWNNPVDPHAYLTAVDDADPAVLTYRGWSISIHGEPKVGVTYDCSEDMNNIYFSDARREAADKPFTDMSFRASKAEGACTVTLESVSAGEISGKFTATVVQIYPVGGDATRKVTNGTFRIPASIGPEPV